MIGKQRVGEKAIEKQRLPAQIQLQVSKGFRPCPNSLNLPFIGFKKRRRLMTSVGICTKNALRSKMSGCLVPSSKGRKQPKSELLESMKNEQKIHPSGQFTGKSVTGTVKQKPVNLDRRSSIKSSSSGSYFASLCISLIFAASLIDITIGSHNLHGFKQSGAYHKTCLQNHTGVWFGQELWLSEKQISTLQQLGTQFVARSGMEDAVSSGILMGRLFGGVNIAWSPHLDHY